VRNAKANGELANAISLARTDEGMIAGNGIGVPLRNEGPSVAHVLPLARGDLRTRLMPQATAAVFITRAESFAPGDIGALAGSFGLTPAETRTLEHLVANATITEAAKALGISATTARTHLAHIFSKTGVSRQADLLTLVSRLVPPVRRPKS
jgi:DNA-binding CsgD family transcriptional regulator